MQQLDDPGSAVLYVDDEEVACKYFERIAGTDHPVLTATSVDEALALLARQGNLVGVVVTDYRMPGRDGGELLEQIEAAYPHLVRILITAYADKDLILRTVNAGHVFRILEKPLNLVEVRRSLRAGIELARARAADRRRLAAMNETLAFVAHELNTPLATMINFARGIGQRVDDGRLAAGPTRTEEIAQACQTIDANARYCLTILGSFVSSVRAASAGAMALPPTQGGPGCWSAASLLQALLDNYPLSPAQRVWLRSEVARDFAITSMPNCVTLALSSLLTNALRALQNHPEPALTVHIDGEAAHIRVTDNGPGIPDSVRERLLADPVTTYAHQGGSGRGLLFCQRIMQSFGGGLSIASAPGSCAVTLQFPAPAELPRRSSH